MSTAFDDANTLHSAVLKLGKRPDIVKRLEALLGWDNNRLRIADEELSSQNRLDYVVAILNKLGGPFPVIEDVRFVARP